VTTKENPAIAALRAALAVSPENVPLRAHLAQVLLGEGLARVALQEYKAALKLSPRDAALKIGAGQAFLALGNVSAALGATVLRAGHAAASERRRVFDQGRASGA